MSLNSGAKKTSIYSEFNIHLNTLVKYIDNIDKKNFIIIWFFY